MSSERRQCMLYVVFSVMIAFQFKNVESFSKGALFRSTNSLVVGRVSDLVLAAAPSAATSTGSFIDTELRGAAMRLHTRQQAPKEGKAKAPAPPKENYVTTHADYLQFLVDNQHVFQTLEDLVNEKPELAVFVNTGLERSAPLEKDICFMVEEYGLPRPAVGKAGTEYAKVLRSIESIPELVCHFYNIYFAHTAGGIMIGKKMSALLLDKKTLEFYKWDGDLNEMKATVKGMIEDMAAKWTPEQRKECVDGTMGSFKGGGSINRYLGGGSPH